MLRLGGPRALRSWKLWLGRCKFARHDAHYEGATEKDNDEKTQFGLEAMMRSEC